MPSISEVELTRFVDTLRAYVKEQPWFEFKENNFEPDRLGKDLCAVHNGALEHHEPMGFVVYGIEDETHGAVGTNLHSDKMKGENGIDDIELFLAKFLSPTPHIYKCPFTYEGVHLIVFGIVNNESMPIKWRNEHFYRLGQSTTSLADKPEILKRLFLNTKASEPFEDRIVESRLKPEEVLALLDAERYFELIKLKMPMENAEVMSALISRGFVKREENLYSITNLGAILYARKLSHFSSLNGRRIRIIHYDGIDKRSAKYDKTGDRGYAAGLSGLVTTVNDLIGSTERMIGARKILQPTYPLIAIREFSANALIHQDFSVGGLQPTISIYSNRIEITNPGVPEIAPERWIDREKARNEKLAQAMREVHLCEQRGSGIDNALIQIGFAHLPGPKFSSAEQSTTTILLGPKEFNKMDSSDRARVCYQHCVLQFVTSQKMTNETLRTRFGLDDSQSSTVSRIIGSALEQRLIRPSNPESSQKNREYLPIWVPISS